MKILNIIELILFVSCFGSVSFAGRESSGGGNLRRSTAVEVKQAIPGDLKYLLFEVIEELKVESPIRIKDEKILPILKKIAAMPIVEEIIYGQPSHFKIHINESGACHDLSSPSRDTDSSIVGDSKQAEVCISIPRLTRYAPTSLQLEVGALLIHELAHAAGFGETDAMAVQQYVVRQLTKTCWYEFDYRDTNGAETNSINVTLRKYTREGLGSSGGYSLGLKDGPEVKIENAFQSNTRWRTLTTSIDNLPSEAKFVITTPESGGSAKFLAMGIDGTIKHVSATWGKLKTDAKRQYYAAENIQALKVTMDDHLLDTVWMGVGGACFNDNL